MTNPIPHNTVSLDELSASQRAVYREVMDALIAGENIWRLITGLAGSGKSLLLRAIVAGMQEMGKKPIVCAPTNMAARNINGQTIHAAFGLNNEDTMTPNFNKDFKNVLMIILDEVSMITAKMLNSICARMGHNVSAESWAPQFIFLVFGDLMQVSNATRDQEVFKGHEWRRFEIRILRENQRAATDPVFNSMFTSIRYGGLSSEHYDLLRRRCLFPEPDTSGTLTPDEVEKVVDHVLKATVRPLMLCWQRRDAHAMNEAVAKRRGFSEPCFDIGGRENVKGVWKIYPESVSICRGSPVIMTRNSGQFVNGEHGVLIDVRMDEVEGFPAFLKIKLRNVVVEVGRREETVPDPQGRKHHILAFPVLVGYACTIHKAQGQTYEKVLVLSHTATTFGCFYVALTRVRKLADVTLTRIAEDKEDFIKSSPAFYAAENELLQRANLTW